MFCPKCGNEIHRASLFCASCGTRPSEMGVPPTGDATPTFGAPVTSSGEAWVPPATGSAVGTVDDVYAAFWRRMVAAVLDSVVLWLGMVIIVVVMAAIGSGDGEGGALVFPISLAGAWLYSALMESSSRQATLGKLALGIKVSDLNGQRIGFGRATGRHFGKLISSITLCIGYVMAGFTRRRQALHDKIAGTLVVTQTANAEQVATAPFAPKVAGWAVVLLVLVGVGIPGIGVLAAIAIPAYQDYTIRAQVADGLTSAAEYKAAVAEAAASGLDWQEITSEALGLETQASSQYLVSIEVIVGAVVLTFGDAANTNLSGRQLVLVPGLSESGDLVWVCGESAAPDGVDLVIEDHEQYTDVESKYLPTSCRS